MTLPQELLDELTEIVKRVTRHEVMAHEKIVLLESTLSSAAGNSVQCMVDAIEAFGAACAAVGAKHGMEAVDDEG